MSYQEQPVNQTNSGHMSPPLLSEAAFSHRRPIAEDLNRIKDERLDAGLPVFNFNQGLVRPPEAWTEAIRGWMKEGVDTVEPWTMGRVPGREGLRSAIAEWRQPLWGTGISSANVLVTLGANTAWSLVMRAISDPGDSIAVTRPYFFNHAGSINRSGRECTFVTTEFGDEVESLQRNYRPVLASENVRAALLSNPHNPTGAHVPREAINGIEASCRELGKWLVLDESYGALHHSDAAFLKSGVGLDSTSTIVIGSLTKSLALGDIRLGYVIADESVIDALTGFADDDYICASQIMQYIGQRAIENRGLVQGLLADGLEARRDVLDRAIHESHYLELASGRSAVFAWIRLPEGVDDAVLAHSLAVQKGILLTPGSSYGVPGCIRISYGMCENASELQLAVQCVDGYLSGRVMPQSCVKIERIPGGGALATRSSQ